MRGKRIKTKEDKMYEKTMEKMQESIEYEPREAYIKPEINIDTNLEEDSRVISGIFSFLVNLILIINIIGIFAIGVYAVDKKHKLFSGRIASYGDRAIVKLSEITGNAKNDEVKEDENKKTVYTEDERRFMQIALEEFGLLGENIDEEDLFLVKKERSGVVYYYISSNKNSVEIREVDHEVVKLNGKLKQ